MGSAFIVAGIVATAVLVVICKSELLGWGPCKRRAEEPELTDPEVKADFAVARGDWTGKVGEEEVVLATGEERPGNMANPGVLDSCGVGMADWA